MKSPVFACAGMHRSRHRGVVLILTIIVLVGMSLAAIALMRSVLSSNRIAANLAFQQSAAHSSRVGVERAIAWLEQQARAKQVVTPASPPSVPEAIMGPAGRLNNHISMAVGEPVAYRAVREDPGDAQNWESFWAAQMAANFVNTLPVDSAGNKVSFMIHRLCSAVGHRDAGAQCDQSPNKIPAPKSSKGSGEAFFMPADVYYRITVRVEGPRNAVSFSQSIVAF